MLIRCRLLHSSFGVRAALRCQFPLGVHACNAGILKAVQYQQACGKAYCSNADTDFLAWIEANPLPEARAHHDSHSQTLLGHSPSHPEHEAHSSIPTGRFSWQETNVLARWCLERYRMQWDDKAYLTSDSTGTPQYELQLPRILQPPTTADPVAHLHTMAADKSSPQCGSQLVVLLAADAAALGLWRNGALVQHKVLTGYTSRRKQGKAQLTYERSGGGQHSMGGSIRAREARRLFQSVSAKLAEWSEDITVCSHLFASGSVRVWNEVYAVRDPPALVDRRDARWARTGLSVRRPRYKDLERVYDSLSHGVLRRISNTAD